MKIFLIWIIIDSESWFYLRQTTILVIKKSKISDQILLTKTKTSETGEEQSEEHTHIFHWHKREKGLNEIKGISYKEFIPATHKSQFLLLWLQQLCENMKISPCILVTKNSPLHHGTALPHTSLCPWNFDQKHHYYCPPSTLLTWLGLLWFFSSPQMKIKLKGCWSGMVEMI